MAGGDAGIIVIQNYKDMLKSIHCKSLSMDERRRIAAAYTLVVGIPWDSVLNEASSIVQVASSGSMLILDECNVRPHPSRPDIRLAYSTSTSRSSLHCLSGIWTTYPAPTPLQESWRRRGLRSTIPRIRHFSLMREQSTASTRTRLIPANIGTSLPAESPCGTTGARQWGSIVS